jgi:hypothetical protein
MVEKRNAYRILVRRPEGKRPLGRPRCRWWIILRLILRDIRWGGVDWTHLTQNRGQWSAFVNMIKDLRVP